jgi:hypothetical protein|tara:strand:- start:1198 stop:1659 length:462 start_codon:yes stop_codon:yes gene_type:complete
MADKFKMYVSRGGSKEEEPVVYEDRLPEGTTLEDLKEKHGVVIWCKYYACINNKQFDDTQRTTGTLRKNDSYKPIVERENVWKGVCTRDEIGINFQEFFSNGAKFKVPACYNAATNITGYMDFSKLLQSDGSPFGGNIDSQSSEHGTEAFGVH